MRIPVVDSSGIPPMPCHPAKARRLLKEGRAHPRRNKLGLFYVQLCHEQEPDNQMLVAGVDPGSKFEGFSVVGTHETVLHLMVKAPAHVKEAVKTRRTMRRARRLRKWRRPKRIHNRLKGKKRLPPSTRSRWEAKARIIAHLQMILPLSDVVVEDVQAVTRTGKGGKGTRSLSLKRGTLLRHPRYGLCTVGGFDRNKQTISLHAYRTNTRLTQRAKVKDCRILTWVAWRCWLVSKERKQSFGKRVRPSRAGKQGTLLSSPA
jgi:hypothetical protein